MKVLIACEFSGGVRDAFLAKGHEAYSCDIVGSSHPNHIQGDVEELLLEPWDLVVAHPPCTYLCNSGVRWLRERENRYSDTIAGAIFFRKCLQVNSPKVCVENPIPHKFAAKLIGTKYTQIIHPWQYGHGETKSTCLWLKNLPDLKPTSIVSGRKPRIHFLSGKLRGLLRSITYPGIAKAMADQWG